MYVCLLKFLGQQLLVAFQLLAPFGNAKQITSKCLFAYYHITDKSCGDQITMACVVAGAAFCMPHHYITVKHSAQALSASCQAKVEVKCQCPAMPGEPSV